MGGIIDYGVSASTKSSPRSVAIEKVQEELRYAINGNISCIFVDDWYGTAGFAL